MERKQNLTRAFGLIQLVTSIAILSMLLILSIPVWQNVVAKSHESINIANLRSIGVACLAYAADRNGYLWDKKSIGHSSYRAFNDPLGLPQILLPYTKNTSTNLWINPAGRPELFKFGNTYAWSRSINVTSKPIASHASKVSSTVLVWDNHTMTLPSVYNVSEPESTGGPRVPSPQSTWRRFPHGKGRGSPHGGTLGWLYLDGHVEIK